MAKIKATRNTSKKDTITGKAAVLFRKKGFSATSMRELADSIGVEAASLYNHIGSKSEILQIICFRVANDFTLHLTETEKLPGGIVARLEELIRFHIRMMIEHFDAVYVANHEWKQLQEPYLSNFLQQRKIYESRMIEMIREGIRQGELRDQDPHVAVLTILSAVRGLEFWQRHKKNAGEKDLEENMINLLLHGLVNK